MSTDVSMSRIPFHPEDERMIASMSVWMRFIGIFTIIGGFLTLFVALLLIALFSTIQHFEQTELRQFYAQLSNGWPFLFGIGILVLAVSGMTIWAGGALHQAGEDFKLVASTDVADQLYLARGLDRLRLFFKLEVLKAGLGVVLVVLFVALVMTTQLAAQ